MSCPCGTGADYARCCGPLHAGAPAPTALTLMRSRYVAYVQGKIDYVVATHAAATRHTVDVAAATRWSRDTQWLGLEILAVDRGGEGDLEGLVEFVARGVTSGAPFAQHERSWFEREDGRWCYVGVAPAPAVKAAPKVGRNEPCTCGSGKKFKKCCGA
jgi:SEC-C motif-containing protein